MRIFVITIFLMVGGVMVANPQQDLNQLTPPVDQKLLSMDELATLGIARPSLDEAQRMYDYPKTGIRPVWLGDVSLIEETKYEKTKRPDGVSPEKSADYGITPSW